MKDPYQEILAEYPATITKEQLCKLCHISKQSARYLLESGVIPCRNNEKKTRKYMIETKDAVAFLRRRKEQPSFYASVMRGNRYTKKKKTVRQPTPVTPELLSEIAEALDVHPDVLTARVVACVLGYSPSAVARWCRKKAFRSFNIHGRLLIPKASLMEYLSSLPFLP